MRTISLRRVYEACVRLRGWDPETSALTKAQKGQYAELITDRVREAYEAELWPDLLKVQQREYRNTWASGTTYAEDDEVFYDDGTDQGYFISLQGSNTNHTPSFTAATAWWEAVGDTFRRTIDFDQSWETDVIGSIDVQNGIFDCDPYVYPNAKPVADCRIVEEAILVGPEQAPVQPYIRFRPVPPQFSLDEWDSGLNYAVGALAYDSGTGECYRALAANTGTFPPDNTSTWVKVDFPYFIFTFVKHAVAADVATDDDGRKRSEAKAQEELDRLRDTLLEQRGEFRRAVFSRS